MSPEAGQGSALLKLTFNQESEHVEGTGSLVTILLGSCSHRALPCCPPPQTSLGLDHYLTLRNSAGPGVVGVWEALSLSLGSRSREH